MKKQFLFFIFLLGLLACNNNSKLQNLVEKKIRNDNKIDIKDFEDISRFLEKNKKDYHSLYNNGQLDRKRTINYLIKNYPSLNLSEENFELNSDNEINSFITNVFIENSLSMNGYVQGNTQFKQDIYTFLSDIKVERISKTLNLNFINNKIPFSQEDANDEQIKRYIKNLNPVTFKQKGGDLKSTQLSSIFQKTLEFVNDENIAILISDCVFSINKLDAKNYLRNEQSSFKLSVSSKLDSMPNLSILGIRMNSDFNGIYYNSKDQPIPLVNQQRPYYIWIFGSILAIKKIINSLSFDRIPMSNFNVYASQNSAINYHINKFPRIGSYKVEDKTTLFDINVEEKGINKGLFGFTLESNLEDLLISESLLKDSTLYRITEGFTLSNIQYQKRINQVSYFVKSENPSIYKELIFELPFINPKWTYKYNIDDDSNFNAENQDLMEKTFGIKYMFDGVLDAYRFNSKKNILFSIKVKIKN